MPYEKSKPEIFSGVESLPEFSAFVENVRFSQIIQEKIHEVNKHLKNLQAETHFSEKVANRLTDVEKQIAELLRMREDHFSRKA